MAPHIHEKRDVMRNWHLMMAGSDAEKSVKLTANSNADILFARRYEAKSADLLAEKIFT